MDMKLIIVLLLLIPVTTNAFEDDPTFGDIVGGHISAAMNAYNGLVRKKAEFNRKIVETREKYWQCGNKCADREIIRNKFAYLLFSKDLYYAQLHLVRQLEYKLQDRSDLLEPQKRSVINIVNQKSGEIDSNIPKKCVVDHSRWALCMGGEDIDKGQINSSGYGDRISSCKDRYQVYLGCRNKFEFRQFPFPYHGRYADLARRYYDKSTLSLREGKMIGELLETYGEQDFLRSINAYFKYDKNRKYNSVNLKEFMKRFLIKGKPREFYTSNLILEDILGSEGVKNKRNYRDRVSRSYKILQQDVAAASDLFSQQSNYSPVLYCKYIDVSGPYKQTWTKRLYIFWKNKRLDILDPGRLRKRLSDHPLLSIRGPVKKCPQTEAQAKSVKLQPSSIVISGAKSPYIGGHYKIQGRNKRGKYTGKARFNKVAGNSYNVTFNFGRNYFTGTGTLKDNEIRIFFRDNSEPAIYTVQGKGRLSGVWSNGAIESATLFEKLIDIDSLGEFNIADIKGLWTGRLECNGKKNKLSYNFNGLDSIPQISLSVVSRPVAGSGEWRGGSYNLGTVKNNVITLAESNYYSRKMRTPVVRLKLDVNTQTMTGTVDHRVCKKLILRKGFNY